MRHSKVSPKILQIALAVAVTSACGGHSKKSKKVEVTPEDTTHVLPQSQTVTEDKADVGQSAPIQPIQTGKTPSNPPVTACSSAYVIPGTANPFLAGAADGTELNYPTSIDTAAQNAPILVVPDDKKCFEAGRRLYFQVEGKIAFGDLPGQDADADGQSNLTPSHQLGSVFSLSDISAPIASLVGVFLDDAIVPARPTAPASLDFSSPQSRNFSVLSPKIGQIFFIGNGKGDKGNLQAVVVPSGTTRLYLAIMDEYEWNNNQGQLTGTIQWVKP